VSTIEQAARRLEQLRKSGVEIGDGTTADSAPGSVEKPATPESVPLRIAKELEARGPDGHDLGASTSTAEVHVTAHSRPAASAPMERARGPQQHVEIDLARLSANGYITPQAPRSRLAEEFRVIKRPLLTNARGKPTASMLNAHRIMVTSSLPGEGKTYVSVNLAISLAMDLDTRVLLVDADASRPAVLERLGLPTSRGLLDLLVNPTLSLGEVILATNVERLSILPAGTAQAESTELLGSEAMSRLVDQLTAHDPRLLVLFDTPPLLSASESRVLAAHMGQVIVVIAADDTPQGTVAEALSTVENCPVVMTLLNRVSLGDRGHYYGSYGAHAH